MQSIFSSWKGRDMEREIFSANVIMLTNGILFLTWDSKVNYWICHIDTLDIHRNFPWSFNNKVLQRAILQGQGCILWVNKAVFCSSFCLFCHFKLYYSPFCDETFQRNLHWGKICSHKEWETICMHFSCRSFCGYSKRKFNYISGLSHFVLLPAVWLAI